MMKMMMMMTRGPEPGFGNTSCLFVGSRLSCHDCPPHESIEINSRGRLGSTVIWPLE